MGSGTWDAASFKAYSKTRGRTVNTSGAVEGDYSDRDLFPNRSLSKLLNPFNVVRECRDSNEHPLSIPVILALDVTGSMGAGAVAVAVRLNKIITDLFSEIKDVEFMFMGIGDLECDRAPVQATQYESDIRIAEQMEQIYFEHGGGGNGYESYTAAWYFGLNHTKLDCWNREKKGIIITLGDEPLNPILHRKELCGVFGDGAKKDVFTDKLYEEASEKFDIYHLAVNDGSTSYRYYSEKIKESFEVYFDEKHLRIVTLDTLAKEIVDIIKNSEAGGNNGFCDSAKAEEISW